jgi:hypothetical protein
MCASTRTWVRIKDNHVVPSKKTTNMLPRKERRTRKERKRRQQPLHISARIPKTIVISMLMPKISFVSYIQS